MSIFNWIKEHKFYILTHKKLYKLISKSFDEGVRFEHQNKQRELRPVLSSLKELKNNTWDKDRVDYMEKWLESIITVDYMIDKNNM